MFATEPPEPAAQPAPTRSGRLIGLVRRLIDYGLQLVRTVQQCASPQQVLDLTGGGFGTAEIALIVARITRGLRRAAALEQRLIRIAPRLDRPPAPARPAASTQARPRPPRPAQPTARPAEIARALLERMPTEEEIAAQVRRRPIGAVLADICGDLGLGDSHPLFQELLDAVTRHGGSFLRLVRDVWDRCNLLNFVPPDTPLIPPMPPGWKPPPAGAARTPPPLAGLGREADQG